MERVVQKIVVSNEKKEWVYSLGGGDRVGLIVPGITAQRLGGKEMGGLIFFRSGGHTDIELLEEPSKWSKAFKDADRIHVRIGEKQFFFDFKGDEIVFATKGFEHLYEAFIVFNDENKLNLIGKQFDEKEFEGAEASTEGILVFDKSPTHIDVEEAKKIHEAYLENNLGTSKHRMPGKDYEELRQWNKEKSKSSSEELYKEGLVACGTTSLNNIAFAHASATISDKDIAVGAARDFIDNHLKNMQYYTLHEDPESVSVSFSFEKNKFE